MKEDKDTEKNQKGEMVGNEDDEVFDNKDENEGSK